MKDKIVLWTICVLCLGCKPIDKQINIYFDPSGAVYLEKISLILKVNDRIILDTIVENSHINSDVFLVSLRKAQNEGALFADINGKKAFIKQLREVSINCTDVFLGYDDTSLIFKEARRIEIEKQDRNIPVDYKQLFDSIKATSGKKYHQIKFNIKKGKCDGE